jgi:acyl-CoA synthetase (AMP-forming)/AMP-acid ligase II
MLAYQGRDDGTDAQGWFRTGDIAYSEDEHYHIVGRTKELIKVRG